MIATPSIELLGTIDVPGAGQVVVRGGFAYVAHMTAPHGISIVDVRDPALPVVVGSIPVEAGMHSHKVRVVGTTMITNLERNHADPDVPRPDSRGGLVAYDVSSPSAPREIGRWSTEPGGGVHRFDFDGRYIYASPTVEGYRGNIVMILDFSDPRVPVEVARWWMPGQWIAGGEQPTWPGTAHRCHHPLRFGDRLYVSYWHGGFVILDISDMCNPVYVSGLQWSPPFGCPTHSAVLVPQLVEGRRLLLVADEDVDRRPGGPPAFLWLVDITDETRPMPFSSFQVDGVEASAPEMTGCHQSVEVIDGTQIPVAWFASGLRILDIAHPHAITEVASFIPQTSGRVSSNDVFVDERGLIYLVDRVHGVSILSRRTHVG